MPERLATARVLIAGVGSLGSPVAATLAGAGVGVIGLADPAAVASDRLEGHLLHLAADDGHNKAERAAARLGAFNPSAEAVPYPARVDELNAAAIVAGHDLVVDCTNDASATLVLNDACLELGVKFLTVRLNGTAAVLTAIVPPDGGCCRCAFPELETAAPDADPPPGAASVVGSLLALEAIKLLTGAGEPLVAQVLHVDLAAPAMETRPYERVTGCEVCG